MAGTAAAGYSADGEHGRRAHTVGRLTRTLVAADGMDDWIDIAASADCPPGTVIERVAGDRIVALAHVDGRWHAIDGLCPHQGGPLGQGSLCGAVVTCPWHGWQFDVTTGRHRLSATVRQAVHDVREEAGRVLVRLRPPRGDRAA